MRLATALLIFSLVTPAASNASQNLPLRIEVLPSEDRWITFADSGRVYHGLEISPVLVQNIFDTGKYVVVLNQNNTNWPKSGDKDALRERQPKVSFNYLDLGYEQAMANHLVYLKSKNAPFSHIRIRPRVETLVYSSGEDGNRVVYGFDPTHLDSYNAGRWGEIGNEFTSENLKTNEQCPSLDFFNKTLSPSTAGPLSPTFGVDADEGVVFSIAGYGFGFKKKKFQVDSEIVIDVEFPFERTKRTYRYKIQGLGKDLFIAGQYQGIGIAIELQRRKTLLKALGEILPNVIAEFRSGLQNPEWKTRIVSGSGKTWIIDGGSADGIEVGTLLISQAGARFQVKTVGLTTSVIESYSGWGASGEILSLQGDAGVRTLALDEGGSESTVKSTFKFSNLTVAPEVAQSASVCFNKKESFIDRFFNSISWLYGLWRSDHVFDQKFESTVINGPKIALISSGIYPKEKKLKGFVENSGFDYVSWDDRPADELGLGTSAAIYLKDNYKGNFGLVPIKVIGPQGQTTSSALYQALINVAARNDIKYVVIPFLPSIKSDAFQQGVEALVSAGKVVILPKGISINGAMSAPASNLDFETTGLHFASLKLSKVGVGVMRELIHQLETRGGEL